MPKFQFDGLSDFLAMGGDAAFVWGSYGVFALFIVWNLLQPMRERRRLLRLLKARRVRDEARNSSINTAYGGE